ncbi:protein STPG3 isoform X3 [Phascolarctos cinereus]|uniref:Protein STPG3 isoform X9 n=1 Tax=Phascolarctos cinereus TaxID=38626 RepID=A0A6P5JYF9_PHACI|nr:protein STPG3 isoform X9 [Phascolarctos cinereus]
MNFDQKAVKFLANFYMNGGQHWTHGGIQTRQPAPPSSRKKLSGNSPVLPMHPQSIERWESMKHSAPQDLQKLPLGGTNLMQEPQLFRVKNIKEFSTSRAMWNGDGDGHRAWQTTWFQSESPFTQKADFLREKQWPSPFHYTQPCNLGPQQPCRPSFPAFTFGHRRVVNKTREPGPSPNTYNVIPGFQLKGPRSPAFSISRAQTLNSWISPAHTPGPAAYYVEDSYNSRFLSAPGVLIQGERRPKRHETGPFCTL